MTTDGVGQVACRGDSPAARQIWRHPVTASTLRTGLESRSAANVPSALGADPGRHGMSVATCRSTMTATDAPGAAAEEA